MYATLMVVRLTSSVALIDLVDMLSNLRRPGATGKVQSTVYNAVSLRL